MLAVSAAGVQASTPSPARAMTLAQVDGGPDYYARFPHGLPTSKSYFPIGVWLESVLSQADVDKDKGAGLNTYDVPTANSNLGLVRQNGMHAIVQADERTLFSPQPGPETNAWFAADEIDMTEGPPGGNGIQHLQQIIQSLPQDRAIIANFGKGILFWESNSDAAQFVNEPGMAWFSADKYWFTDPNCDSAPGVVSGGGCGRVAANYGWIVDRERGLVNPLGSRPVWAVVEVGWPFTETAAQGARTIAPAEIRAAVWQSIIAGARGIIYFNHSFGGPCQTQHALRDPCYASVRAMVSSVNAQITQLAPVLNSPTVRSGWSQGAGTTAMVKWAEGTKAKAKAKKRCKSKKGKKKKCKKAKGKKAKAKKRCKSKKGKKCKKAKGKTAEGHLYVFAGSAGSPVEGRFSLPCVGDAQAAVVGENRTIPVRGGSLSDHFADGNAIHIYRIDGGSTCGLPREGKVPNAGLAGGGDPATSSKTFPRVIVAAIVVFLVGMLAFVRTGRLPKRARRPRSGKRAKRTQRLAIRSPSDTR